MPSYLPSYSSLHMERQREGRLFAEWLEASGDLPRGAAGELRQEWLMMLGHAVQYGEQRAFGRMAAVPLEEPAEPEKHRFEMLDLKDLDLEK